MADGIKVKGFYRVQLTEGKGKDLKVVGDSGWRKNTVVNEGFDDFLCRLLANTTSSKQVGYIEIGTGTAPNATHDTLNGGLGSDNRVAVTVSISQSKTARFTATFNSSDSFLGGQSNLRNIGLIDVNTAAGSMFAASTYASSTCDTNQNVNVTYDIGFA